MNRPIDAQIARLHFLLLMIVCAIYKSRMLCYANLLWNESGFISAQDDNNIMKINNNVTALHNTYALRVK